MSLIGRKKRVTYWAKDYLFFKGEKRKIYNDIKEDIRNFSKEENEKRFKDIKEYAINNTEYYSNYLLTDEFPIMNKNIYRDNYNKLKSRENFKKPIHLTSTSGSTGVPFTLEQNYLKRQRLIMELKAYGELTNYQSHEKMIHLRGMGKVEIDRSIDKKENIWRYDISELGEKEIEELIDFILKWNPEVILGYANTIETICNYIIKKDKKIKFNCNSLIVTSTVLGDDVARKIKKIFKCPLFDRYSNMEMGIYAQREYGVTNFLINTSSYKMEILKMEVDKEAEEGEIGRIIVTDLFNKAFPMIRYDTGDLGIYKLNNGRMELTEIQGRRLDAIYSTKGSIINSLGIWKSISEIEKIYQWQFIQEEGKKYKLVLNKSGEINEDKIITNLKRLLGKDSNIIIEYTNEIPVLDSQKRKYMINNIKKGAKPLNPA